MWSSEDHLVPPTLAEVFQAGIPQAEITFVPGAGHALLLEQPQRAAELVTQFLKR